MRHIVLDFDGRPVDLTALFARVPDSVVLRVSSRDIVLHDGETCLCGWVLREKIAELRNVDADTIRPYDETPMLSVTMECTHLFGGDLGEWEAVFDGVQFTFALPLIERAWVQRLNKAVSRSAA